MKKIIIFFILTLFLVRCQNNQGLNFNAIEVTHNFYYDSKKDNTAKKVLDDSFKSLLQSSALYSRDGAYWENRDFNLYPINLVESDKGKTLFVLKEIQLIEGQLTELYLIKINQNNELVVAMKIAKQESSANCESDFTLQINKMIAEVIQNEACEAGSKSEDENEVSVKTRSEKVLIAFDK